MTSSNCSMYTVTWHRHPNGIEGEEMTYCWRDFQDLEKAIAFLNKRVMLIKSINWAGGYIEDETGDLIYEIDDEGDAFDNRKENKIT